MTGRSPLSTCQRQRAFTLIELMISVALSLVFLSGLIMFVVSSQQIQNIQKASSRTQENARFALDELSASIRMAGFHNELSPGNDIPSGQFYLGSCGNFDPCTADGTSPETHGSDRIAILVNPPEDDGTDGDCQGNPVSGDVVEAANSVVINLYRIEKGSSYNTLVCESYLQDSAGNTSLINEEPYEIVSGIDAMQLLYGVSDTESSGQVNYSLTRYLSASEVSALDPPAGLPSAWINISAVRVALLAGSATDNRAATHKEQTFKLLDQPPMTIQDNAYRKVYDSTVQINNARR